MDDVDRRAERIRRFNRLYTREIGVLTDGLLHSPYSLTEARVLYEIAHRRDATANRLCKELGLDAGYVSRIVTSFRERGLVSRDTASTDRRQHILSLTPKGRSEFATLDQRSHEEARAKLGQLSATDQEELVQALERVGTLLGKRSIVSAPFVLRPHRAGDIGWVVERHGVLYSQEYGWDSSFEALVAEIAGQFIRNFDPKREACWIAERHGARVGSVFLVRKTDRVAQLRLLLVEPSARGFGLGRHLVQECVRFARDAGYQTITLWTNSILHAARRIYEETGFRLVDEKPHHSFGKDLVGQTWELAIANCY
ncbi:MAG: helix-turn-helix domain-containing GNAT family N-acetyltransferase [Bryobacteraceae bacterium]|jgi:DNA-binding MarR family transcriptional regulator/GNAT superfamily N-acetyltransferase